MKLLSAYVKKGLFYKSVVEDGSDIIFIVTMKERFSTIIIP
jgi:hypothetical protein